jgi:hypothetical protein
MEIEPGVVVLYIGENEKFFGDWKKRIGCVVQTNDSRSTVAGKFIHGGLWGGLQRSNLIPLLKLSDDDENRKKPDYMEYIINAFKDLIIESLIRIILQIDDKSLRKALFEAVAKK